MTTIHHGDCIEVMSQMPPESVDAIVTDPPYGLSNTTPAQVADTITKWAGGDRDHVPTGRGFMGKSWDAFVPPPAVWDECLRVLKPGGHMLVFAGSRTQDLMGLSIRLAGFETRDSLAWLYGAGFPKSHDVSKAIDKLAGAEREVIGDSPYAARKPNGSAGVASVGLSATPGAVITAPATPEAAQWDGWGTALKPGHEPVVCARKPLNVVPLDWRLVADVHHALAGLLWLSLSPAKRAELASPSSPAGQLAGACVSALVSAALDTSPDASDQTATFNSPALASTSSNIASSWNATLGALSARTRTSTTSTASSTTTALRTLNSLLGPITSQTTMPKCGCLLGGPSSPAPSVASSSSDEWARWLHTLSASVPATATEGIALAVASALAQVAGELSDAPAGASSATQTATTGAAASRSAFEPIVLARKPLAEKTVARNVLTHGTGAINIDACRIAATPDDLALMEARSHPNGTVAGANGGHIHMQWDKPNGFKSNPAGRWPANVLLDQHAAAGIDEQSGDMKGRVGMTQHSSANRIYGKFAPSEKSLAVDGTPDEGGASRFFYTAKASKRERPNVDGVQHETVKPLAIMRWLLRLVTPPGGTVLDPFAGSGTTIEAALIEGFNPIGIEMEADYLPLIQHRIDRQAEQLDI